MGFNLFGASSESSTRQSQTTLGATSVYGTSLQQQGGGTIANLSGANTLTAWGNRASAAKDNALAGNTVGHGFIVGAGGAGYQFGNIASGAIVNLTGATADQLSGIAAPFAKALSTISELVGKSPEQMALNTPQAGTVGAGAVAAESSKWTIGIVAAAVVGALYLYFSYSGKGE